MYAIRSYYVAYRLGRLVEAEEFLRRAWTMEKNPEIAAHLGEVLWQQGKREQAMEIWREAKTVDETNQILIDTLERLDAEL